MRLWAKLTLFLIPLIVVPSAQAETNSQATRFEKEGVIFTRLDDTVWLHSTFTTVEKWGRVISNGLIVTKGRQAILIDTAWDDEQTSVILEWASTTLGSPITAAVVTHAHSDKIGGLKALREAQIPSYAHPKTNTLAPSRGLLPADYNLVLLADGHLQAPQQQGNNMVSLLDIFYPGHGHSEDNIVVRVKDSPVLFGGCFIRPKGSKSLGNTADASIADWAVAAQKLPDEFPEASIIVPSHGSPAGRELLSLTYQLAVAALNTTTPN